MAHPLPPGSLPPGTRLDLADAAPLLHGIIARWMKTHGRTLQPKLSEQKKRELEEIFHLMDLDGSGAVDGTELKEAFNLLGIHLSDKEIQDLMDEVDRDRTGELEMAEYLEIMTDTLQQIATQPQDDGEIRLPFALVSTAYRRKRWLESVMSGDRGGISHLTHMNESGERPWLDAQGNEGQDLPAQPSCRQDSRLSDSRLSLGPLSHNLKAMKEAAQSRLLSLQGVDEALLRGLSPRQRQVLAEVAEQHILSTRQPVGDRTTSSGPGTPRALAIINTAAAMRTQPYTQTDTTTASPSYTQSPPTYTPQRHTSTPGLHIDIPSTSGTDDSSTKVALVVSPRGNQGWGTGMVGVQQQRPATSARVATPSSPGRPRTPINPADPRFTADRKRAVGEILGSPREGGGNPWAAVSSRPGMTSCGLSPRSKVAQSPKVCSKTLVGLLTPRSYRSGVGDSPYHRSITATPMDPGPGYHLTSVTVAKPTNAVEASRAREHKAEHFSHVQRSAEQSPRVQMAAQGSPREFTTRLSPRDYIAQVLQRGTQARDDILAQAGGSESPADAAATAYSQKPSTPRRSSNSRVPKLSLVALRASSNGSASAQSTNRQTAVQPQSARGVGASPRHSASWVAPDSARTPLSEGGSGSPRFSFAKLEVGSYLSPRSALYSECASPKQWGASLPEAMQVMERDSTQKLAARSTFVGRQLLLQADD